MMENLQEATSRQVKLLTGRLNEALSNGLELLHSELGVDLGLKPELIPPWVVLLAACVGLVLLVALWASACRCLFRRRPAQAAPDGGSGVKPDGVKPPAVKAEDQKKKKKKTEKKAQAAQPNGSAVPEPQDEEAMVSEDIVPHHQSPPPEVKTEKASEVKKSKKKAKQVAKDTKTVTADGKEPEEGTWETKVSNKEKREQRKKDKTSSDGSASPGGGSVPTGAPQEMPKPAPAPAGQKKKKGESTKVKVEKVEAVASQVRGSDPASSSVKAPAHTAAQTPGRWAVKREPATLWGSEIDGSWTVIESGMKTSDQNQVSSFSGLAAEPLADLPWTGQPKVEDEWSGQNGVTVDASSDWNFPTEDWGNYEEPTPDPPAAQPAVLPEPSKVSLLTEAADDEDDEKDKADAGDAAGKTKRRKKKKRKVAEEGGQGSQDSEEPEKEAVPEAPVKKQQPAQEKPPAVQPAKTTAAAAVVRAERPVKEVLTQKPPVTPVPQKPCDAESTAKQNVLPAPAQQKKAEESQAPKPVKKRKARRET